MIQFSSINKTYNPGLFKKKVKAVSDLNLEISPGEVFGLIGPNGAGKSTTIRMLLSLIRPDSGEIYFQGKLLGETRFQKEIGYLPENPYLYDHLTLLELLDFCGKTSGLKPDHVKSRLDELMSRLGLMEAQKRPLRTFSKGMLQRAGICFALLHDPAIVILDEPMSGLDPMGRKMVFDLVVDLKKRGKTVFFCSHILNDVERLCDRIGLLHKGHLVKEFSRDEFLPKSGNTVFLRTADLTSEQQENLTTLGGDIRRESEGYLLAVQESNYFAVNDYMHRSSIRVLGCRSEWVSLEELFLQVIREQGQ